MKRTLSIALLSLALVGSVRAQDAKPDTAPAKPAAATLDTNLEDARARAAAERKPLLVLAVPDWFESQAEAWVRDEVGEAAKSTLSNYVIVLVEESTEREVHRRHRIPAGAYPAAVVLDSEGAYLGSISGRVAPAEGETWADALARIPERRNRTTALRERLAESPEDPGLLFELADVWNALGEPARARPLLERLIRSDPLDRSGHLGEARFRVLREDVEAHLTAGRFASVEAPTLKWLRRFGEHDRAPAVRWLRSSALFLAGKRADARELWKSLVADHADTDAGKRAKDALAKLGKD